MTRRRSRPPLALDGDLPPRLRRHSAQPLLDGALLPVVLWHGGDEVVVVAAEYPEAGDTGSPIEGIEAARELGALVFHAGTDASQRERLVTNGGRILGLTGTGESLEEARTACLRGGGEDLSCRRAVSSRHRWLIPPLPPRLVGILVGADLDRERMSPRPTSRSGRGIACELEVRPAPPRSPRRSPSTPARPGSAKSASSSPVPGWPPPLPGVVAAHTDLPVIGVPLRSSKSVLDGLDAPLSIAEMPPGRAGRVCGWDNARNAALLAVRILDSP